LRALQIGVLDTALPRNVGGDVSNGSINITGNIFRCNGQQVSAPDSTITISGITSSNSVQIIDSSPIIILESVSVESRAPFTVDNSNTLIILSGLNYIASTSSLDSAISCRGSSNITFQAVSSGTLTAIGFGFGSGIGYAPSLFFLTVEERCDVLRFVNGSYVAGGLQQGCGIGSGSVVEGRSTVNQIVFNDGSYNATSTYDGPGIGSGYREHGDSTVNQIVFINGSYNASTRSGVSGIGSGRAY
jgi:hypothetical protein